MTDCITDALVPFGWNDRVAALYAEIADAAGPGAWPARVVRVERSACIVTTGDTEHMARAPVLPAVGDWVAVHRDGPDDDVLTVAAVADRWSQLTRRDPMGATQVLAADIDLVLVTAPADRPSLGRVEREVMVGWDSGARPVVLLTKYDVAPPDMADEFRRRLVGTDIVPVSVVTGAGVEEVAALLAGPPARTAVLLGPSGAGKSSLANALLGDGTLAVGAVRHGDSRGRHTTTSRHLFVVPAGGVLIDTPGIRSLSLAGDSGGLDAAFPEIDELSAGCRFSDCRHEQEPQCAVLAAVDRGDLDAARLASYQKLGRELAFEERRDDPLARQAHENLWKARIKVGKQRARKR